MGMFSCREGERVPESLILSLYLTKSSSARSQQRTKNYGSITKKKVYCISFRFYPQLSDVLSVAKTGLKAFVQPRLRAEALQRAGADKADKSG
jgi:hypothetical protein